MKVKRNLLIILLGMILLLSGMLALLMAQQRQAESAAKSAAEGSIQLLAFLDGELETITLERGEEVLTLAPSADGWNLLEDPEYHLDGAVCNTICNALAGLSAKRKLSAEAEEEYGLEQPQTVVTVTAAGQTSAFRFGARNPTTGDVYLQKEGDEAIYTVAEEKLSEVLTDKTSLFGAFCPAGLTRSDIVSVTYTLPTGETVRLRAGSEPLKTEAENEEENPYQTVWRLADEPEKELDEDKVDEILSALSSYASAQITRAEPDDYGFDTPAVTVQVQTAEKEVTLTYASGTDGVYLMVERDYSVYKVDLSVLSRLTRTQQELLVEE